MSLIEDIKYELGQLDYSATTLKRNALTLASAFLVFSAVLFFAGVLYIGLILFLISFVLLFSGFLVPQKLKSFYKIWMSIALVLGWFMSRLILAILFYLVIAPIGFIARLAGKDFIEKRFRENKASYWIKKDPDKPSNYTKMY